METSMSVLWFLLMVNVMVLCVKLNSGPQCNNVVTYQDTKPTKLELKKYKACPKDAKPCTPRENKILKINKKTHRCCHMPYGPVKTKIEKVCCEKYIFNFEKDTCEPQCKDGCENGMCLEPDVCHCEMPRVLLGTNQCVLPVCEPPCVNSQCTANNTCTCNPNFQPFNATHCAQNCEPGFQNDPMTLSCVPKCDSSCLNATCTEPNVCTCFEGFVKTDDHTCVPNCTPSCVNAVCVAPNVCSCFEGYKDDSSTCTPICDLCENGSCVAPNICECNSGYSMENGMCSPVCHDCEHGDCVAPDTCECHEGYSNENGICAPVCDICEHGDCIAPNTCECHKGFTPANGTCIAVCEEPCVNGICSHSHPNVCDCHSGYEPDPEYIFNCRPTCDPVCVNASCIFPNTCSCNSGYEVAGNGWTCKPKCVICEHGDCVGPNQCSCYAGYSKKGSDKCTADCDKNCVNSVCESPNNCVCLGGYKPTGDKFVCEPKCIACKNGECIAPGKCECHEGYTKINRICSPVCSEPCVNGHCTAPDTCTCREGYVNNSTITSVCYKNCERPCSFGQCSINGTCICDRGYELQNDTCSPIIPVECSSCQVDCLSGDCWCPNDIPCTSQPGVAEVSSTGIAGLELTWLLCGAVALLLLVMVLVVMQRLWRRRKQFQDKAEQCEGNTYNSVLYTRSNTLLRRDIPEEYQDEATEPVNAEATKPVNDEETEPLNNEMTEPLNCGTTAYYGDDFVRDGSQRLHVSEIKNDEHV